MALEKITLPRPWEKGSVGSVAWPDGSQLHASLPAAKLEGPLVAHHAVRVGADIGFHDHRPNDDDIRPSTMKTTRGEPVAAADGKKTFTILHTTISTQA